MARAVIASFECAHIATAHLLEEADVSSGATWTEREGELRSFASVSESIRHTRQAV